MLTKIHNLNAPRSLRISAKMRVAELAAARARQATRDRRDELDAVERDDRKAGAIVASAAAVAARVRLDEAYAALRKARADQDAAAKEAGAKFLESIALEASEIQAATLEIANALEALTARSAAVSYFAGRHGLPCHLIFASLGRMGDIVQRLKATP
jgi:hypothetical protein